MKAIYKNLTEINKYRVKVFKSVHSMNKFLNKGNNALFWKECKGENIPKKNGVYFTQGLERKWINVNELMFF